MDKDLTNGIILLALAYILTGVMIGFVVSVVTDPDVDGVTKAIVSLVTLGYGMYRVGTDPAIQVWRDID